MNVNETEAERLLNIGAAYYNGNGCNQDFAKAVEYYKKSAKLGNTIAMSNLGYCYLYGRSVPVDESKALYCFEKASEAGDICATYKIGDFYMRGKGAITVDKQKAVEFYERAYEMATDDENPESFDNESYPDACLRLADCYFYGTCNKRDYNKALKLYNAAFDGFEIRVMNGDKFTDKLLDKAQLGMQKCKKELNK